MPETLIHDTLALRSWFERSGVSVPLKTCIGPLPTSRAAIVRWTSEQADPSIQEISPHPGSYRIAVMLEPLEARIWSQNKQIWSGMIAANRFRICPPGDTNRWSRMSGCDIANIFLPIDWLDQLSQLRGELTSSELLGNSFTPDKTVIDLVQKMLNAQALAGPLDAQFCDAMMMALTSYLLEHYTKPNTQEEQSNLSGARLRKVMAYMNDSLAEEISIAGLAAICGMSESHFSREFRRAVGLPPHQYMMKKRLEQACQALLLADARIVDIAYEFGFHNASHFSRSFHAYFGMPPASFRREKQILN